MIKTAGEVEKVFEFSVVNNLCNVFSWSFTYKFKRFKFRCKVYIARLSSIA